MDKISGYDIKAFPLLPMHNNLYQLPPSFYKLTVQMAPHISQKQGCRFRANLTEICIDRRYVNLCRHTARSLSHGSAAQTLNCTNKKASSTTSIKS